MVKYQKPITLSAVTLCTVILAACGSNGVTPSTEQPEIPAAANPDTDTQPAAPEASEESAGETPEQTPAQTPEQTPAQTPAGTPEPAAALPAADRTLSCSASALEFQATFLLLMNEARAQPRQCGSTTHDAAPAVKWNNQLYSAAVSHSVDMSSNDFFDHTGSDNSEVQDRVDTTGYAWQTVGENIAAGQRTAEEVMNGWLNSEGHCRNIMNPDYEDVAVTCVQDTTAKFTTYWTNVLGAEF